MRLRSPACITPTLGPTSCITPNTAARCSALQHALDRGHGGG